MTRRLSDWSKPGEKPPMVGVWETDYCGRASFNFWNGRTWGPSHQTVRAAYRFREGYQFRGETWLFRGLADKPE